ncbi:MAG: hypothetical protein ACRYE9_00325 [Janthinobacterium lividum]
MDGLTGSLTAPVSFAHLQEIEANYPHGSVSTDESIILQKLYYQDRPELQEAGTYLRSISDT